MIERVRLEGWRSHWESEFKFSAGTNALLGIMGSGKTSVVDAICFALFGTFPAHNSRKVKLEDVVMKRPQERKKAEVEVELEKGGKDYLVRRVIEDGRTSEAEIREDGRLMDSGPSNVTSAVERILETDYDVFSRAVYSEQNGLGYFLEIPRGQRKEKVDELLHINRFESARSTTTTVLNRLRDNLEEKKSMVKDMEEGEELDRLGEVREEIGELRETIDERKERVEELEEEVERLEDIQEDVEEKKNRLKELEVSEGKVEGTIETLEDDVEEMDADEVRQELDDAMNERDEMEEEIEELGEKEGEVKSDIQRIDISVEDLEEEIERLQEVGAECPLCGQEIDDEHRERHISEMEEEIKGLREDREGLEEELESIQEKLESKEQAFRETEARADALEKKMERAEEMEEKKERLEELREQLEDIRTEKDELEERIEPGMDVQEELREASSELSGLREKIRSDRSTLEDREEELERLQERKERFERYQRQIEKMESLAADLEKFYTALEETQIELRQRFIETVNTTMSDLWETLYPYQDYIDIRLAVEDDYILQLKESGGGWVPVEGVASGGERTTALLALRMAFALVLAPNLRWLVLDEPTHNLDTNGVEQLAEVLRDRVEEYVDQVFLITHDEKLEDAVTGYLYRLERERQKDEPTDVKLVMDPTRAA